MRFPSTAAARQRLVEKSDMALRIDRQCGIDAIGNGAKIGRPGNAAVGRAPNVNGVVITSSPLTTPNAMSANKRASDPEAQPKE